MARLRAMRDSVPSTPLFSSVLCGTDNGSSGLAARHQAAWLAEPEGAVKLVPTRALTRHGPRALVAQCAGHDLLVLGSEPEPHALIRHAPIPVLLARWCRERCDVTDEILVAVGGEAGAARAAELAARIAARRRGAVSIVAAPGRSRDVERALAAAGRIILCTVGSTPPVLVEPVPPELAVPRAAAEIGASLLVVSVGDDAWDAALASDIARRAGCSLLTVPVPVPVTRRFDRAGGDRALVPGNERRPGRHARPARRGGGRPAGGAGRRHDVAVSRPPDQLVRRAARLERLRRARNRHLLMTSVGGPAERVPVKPRRVPLDIHLGPARDGERRGGVLPVLGW